MSETAELFTPLEEQLETERQFSPTHILTEEGLEPIIAKPKQASPQQIALMEDPQFLMTGLEWAGLMMAGRMEIMIAIALPTQLCGANDILQVLPEQSKQWLTGWQQQVNSGSCWRTSGSIGRTADRLIDDGYLLLAKGEIKDWMGHQVATRDSVRPGRPGSPLFVKHLMGENYLRWIAAVD